MGLFSSKKTKEKSELNAFLGVGTEYKGKLDFTGTVRIDGRFEGEISTEGVLILGRKARIEGTVCVGQLNSCGEILGEVRVKEKAVFEKTSVLKGSLDTPVLVVEKGAVVEGTINMTQGSATETKPKVVSANFGGANPRPVAREPEIAKTGSDDSGV
jgi:cytoskeletal protein CcmA (bactofilin family)